MQTTNDPESPTMQQVVLSSEITVELVAGQSTDDDIVRAARVSTYGSGSFERSTNAEGAKGLIRFLMRNRHGSPFEHTFFTFYVHAPVFAVRHLMRHRTWSFNEESARYRELEPTFYQPDSSRLLRQSGKPGHYIFHQGSQDDYQVVLEQTRRSYTTAWSAYQAMLEQGVAREVSRLVLPNAIYTSVYATCNARALMTFLSLRTLREDSLFPSFPQHEISVIAEKMERYFEKMLPLTQQAFNDARRVAP